MLRPTPSRRMLFFILSDAFIFLFSLFLAYQLRFNFDVDPSIWKTFPIIYILVASLKIVFMYRWRLYHIVWRFFGLNESKNAIKAHIVAYVVMFALYAVASDIINPFPRSVLLIDFGLSLMFVGFLRISKRLIIESGLADEQKAAVIIGVERQTDQILRGITSGSLPFYAAGIVANHNQGDEVIGSYMGNLRVHSFLDLEKVVKEGRVEAAIIASEMPREELNIVFEQLNALDIHEIKLVKFLGDSVEESIKDIAIEDLLARKPKDLDTEVIGEFLNDKVVMVTGAGGSIGSEICNQCVKFGVKELILVEHSEYNLYQVAEQLSLKNISLKLLSVTDKIALDTVFSTYEPEVVIHAAAYKHVPICEDNQKSAIVNNIIGSKNVIDCSIEHKVSKVVIISTDKAVRPTNVMGATKRVVELYAQNVSSFDTEIVAVRFGNVLGSSGSVIPKFKIQIESGGPVTVTHQEITRYFMMIPEACQLVLQAASIAKGGELFILDMGKPIRIAELAQKMIALYGKEDSVNIEYTGLRPGEKLYEELLISDNEHKTIYDSIFIANLASYDIDKLSQDINRLIEAEDSIAALQTIVPEFNHKP